jgi:hypothetical protein
MLEKWSSDTKTQTYVLDRPLVESKYAYSHTDALVVLAVKPPRSIEPV